jgi:hypothetical protein
MRRFQLIPILFLFVQCPSAHAWSLYFVGIGTNHIESRDAVSGTESSSLAPGFGSFMVFTMAPKLEFQTGILFITQRRINTSVSDITTIQNKKAFQFPVIVRFSPSSWFHVGVGPYFSLGLGADQIVGTQSRSVSLDSLGLKSSDIGIIGIIGTGYEFGDFFDKPVSIVADIAYTIGFGSLVADSTLAGATSIKYNGLHLIVGFRLDI